LERLFRKIKTGCSLNTEALWSDQIDNRED
jgi:hypothetical protein